MRKINGYHYINLARRKDRNIFMQYSLRGAGFEVSEIKRFEAVNGKAYKNWRNIARAASKEFPNFEHLIENDMRWQDGVCNLNPRDLAINYSWCRLLKMLAETLGEQEYACCGTDDILLRTTKQQLQSFINSMDLDILHLSHRPPTRYQITHSIDGIDFVQGVAGCGDLLIIVNNIGASTWLNWILQNIEWFCDIQPTFRDKSELQRYFCTTASGKLFSHIPEDVCASTRFSH